MHGSERQEGTGVFPARGTEERQEGTGVFPARGTEERQEGTGVFPARGTAPLEMYRDYQLREN